MSILLVDDGGMRDLNREWRSTDRTTDVLAFPQNDKPGKHASKGMLGDIVISVETAARQARERGVRLDEEISALLVHGILHLLGHDHESGGKKAGAMRKKEKEILDMLYGEIK